MVLLTVAFNHAAVCQSNNLMSDTTLLSIPIDTSDLNPELCLKMHELALRKAKNDSLYVPEFGDYEVSRTLKEILKREYGFFSNDIIGGDIIPIEIGCFEHKSREIILKKFGANFLDSLKVVSNHLDSTGTGYYPARFEHNEMNAFDYVVSLHPNFPELMANRDIFRILIFDVLEDGSVANLQCREGYQNVHIELLDSDPGIKSEFENIIKKMPKWQPARLKGKEVQSRFCIILNGGYMTE